MWVQGTRSILSLNQMSETRGCLERGKSVGVAREFVDADEQTPARIAPVRPWQQAPITIGVVRYKFAK